MKQKLLCIGLILILLFSINGFSKSKKGVRVILQAEAIWKFKIVNAGAGSTPSLKLVEIKKPEFLPLQFMPNSPRSLGAINKYTTEGVEFKYGIEGVNEDIFFLINQMYRYLYLDTGYGNLAYWAELPPLHVPSYEDSKAVLREIIFEIGKGAAIKIGLKIGIDILKEVWLKKLTYPYGFLTDAMIVFGQAYLDGDTASLKDAAVDQLIGSTKGLKFIGDDSVADPLVDLLKMGYGETKKWLDEELKDLTGFSFYPYGEKDKCKWNFLVKWDRKSGALVYRMEKILGTPPPDLNMEFEPGSGDPGQDATLEKIQVTLFNKPVTIFSINKLIGFEAISDEAPKITVPAKNPKVKFKLKKPLEDKEYTVECTVTIYDNLKFPGTGNFTVNNVPPKILEVTPPDKKVKPDEALTFSTTITVQDDNADENNEKEIKKSKKNLKIAGHPKGLNTTKLFKKWDTINQLGQPDKDGIYQFKLSVDGGNVKYPHEHGKFTTQIEVSDGKLSALHDITIEVEDITPELLNFQVIPEYVHTGEEKRFYVTGTFKDKNGVKFKDGSNDIVGAYVDASKGAGGEKYSYGNNFEKEDEDKDTIEVKTPTWSKEFLLPGDYPIEIKVWGVDSEGNETFFEDEINIHVGNEPPFSRTWGFTHNPNGLIKRSDMDYSQDRNCCPGEFITVGIIVHDPEGDELTVTAGIKGKEQKTELKKDALSSTYIGTIQVPSEPGEYEIEFTATESKEKKPNPPITKTIKVEVVPCDEKESNVSVSVGPGTGTFSPGNLGEYVDEENDNYEKMFCPVANNVLQETNMPSGAFYPEISVAWLPLYFYNKDGDPLINYGPEIGFGWQSWDGNSSFSASPREMNNNAGKSYDRIKASLPSSSFDHNFSVSNTYLFAGLRAKIDPSFFMKLPLKLKFSAYAGINLAFGSMEYLFEATGPSGLNDTYNFTSLQEVNATVLGLRFGAGVSMEVSKLIGVGLELSGGSTTFSNWSGTRSDKAIVGDSGVQEEIFEGDLWITTIVDNFGNKFTELLVLPESPGGNATKVKTTFNRWGLKLNVTFNLPYSFQLNKRK